MQTLLQNNERQKKYNSVLLKRQKTERTKTGLKNRKQFQQLTDRKDDMVFSSARSKKDPIQTLKILSVIKPTSRNETNYSPSQLLNSMMTNHEILASSQIINKEDNPNCKMQKRVKHFENEMERIRYQGYLDKCHHLNKLKDQLRKHKDHLSKTVK